MTTDDTPSHVQLLDRVFTDRKAYAELPVANRDMTAWDICFTSFMNNFNANSEDGGKSDWYNDTRAKIEPFMAALHAELAEAFKALHAETEGWRERALAAEKALGESMVTLPLPPP